MPILRYHVPEMYVCTEYLQSTRSVRHTYGYSGGFPWPCLLLHHDTGTADPGTLFGVNSF